MSTAVKKKIFDNRYEIISILSRGANSVIYLGKTLQAPYNNIALKVLTNRKNETNVAERLRSEAIAMVASRHKYVMPLDDFNTVGDISYLSMDYAHESDLRNFILKNGKLSTKQTTRFLKQIAEAVAHIHNEGIIHHDIKPDNILVINDRLVKLTDFDLATMPGQNTEINELQKGVGTLDYMAPEILEGISCGFSSDIYALALTFYEIFTGINPFSNIPLSQILDVRKEPIENISKLVPEIDSNIAHAIMNSLTYIEKDRIQNGTEFLNAINDPEFGLIKKSGTELPLSSSNIELNTDLIMAEDNKKDQSWDDFLNELENPNDTELKSDDTSLSKKVEKSNHQLTKDPFATTEMPKAKTDNSWDNFLSELEDPKTVTKTDLSQTEEKFNNPLKSDPFTTTEIPESKLNTSLDNFVDDLEESKSVDNNNSPSRTEKITDPFASEEPKDKSEDSWDDFLKSLEDDSKTEKVEDKSADDKAWDDFLKSLESEADITEKKEPTPTVSLSELNTKIKPNIDEFQNVEEPNIDNFFSEIKDEEAIERTPINIQPVSNNSNIFSKLKFIGIALLILWIVKSFFMSSSTTEVVENHEVKVDTAVVHNINIGNFPYLEPGIYNAKIYGLFPGETKTLTIVANDSKKLLIFMDIVGWQPSIIDLNSIKTHPGKLTIASNGYILKLNTVTNGEKFKFKDEATKIRGEWEIISKN